MYICICVCMNIYIYTYIHIYIYIYICDCWKDLRGLREKNIQQKRQIASEGESLRTRERHNS